MTDKELIKQIRINDNLAMKEILHRYGGYVAAVIYNATGSAISQNDRDEVVADVFIALWKNSSKLDEAKPLKCYWQMQLGQFWQTKFPHLLLH